MSLVGKPGYKETSAGWMPIEWTATTLGNEVESIVGGGTPSKDVAEYWGGDIPWASVKDFVGSRLSKTQDCITRQAVKASATNLIPAGTLITPTRMALGRVAVFDCEVAINQDLKAIFPKPSLLKDFLFFWFQNHAHRIEAAGTGSTVKGIRLEVLREFGVALPPLPEQQRISTILTAVDEKLDVIARQIEAAQSLKQGLMQTLFSRGVGTQDADGRWVPHAEFKDSELGRIPAGWTMMPLEELAVENITYGVVQPGESVEGGIPLVRGGDIKRGRIAANLRTVSTEISNQFKRTILKGGELLVSLVGYPGETAVVPSQLAGANIARQAGMIRTGSVSTSEFIHYYLSSPVGKSFLLAGMIGSAQQVINLKALREVLIPLPSVAERVRICSICSAVTKKLQVLEYKQSSFQDLKRGLMQKLLTGEWRVSVNASATGT